MDKELICEVKKKKEFSGLPDSIVERALVVSKEDVKEARAFLRKYFGVFLTNRVLKGKSSPEEMLAAHMSSKKRDYSEFYREIFSGQESLEAQNFSKEKSSPTHPNSRSFASNIRDSSNGHRENIGSIIDLGAGANGFSYPALREVAGDVKYLAVEAAGQLVDQMNNYFRDRGFEGAHAIREDLFNVEKVVALLKGYGQFKPRVVFMLQVVDALENMERNFSKKFISEISEECENIVLSLPTESLGGRKKFAVQRKWLVDFLEENFVVEKDFRMSGERVFVFRKK